MRRVRRTNKLHKRIQLQWLWCSHKSVRKFVHVPQIENRKWREQRHKLKCQSFIDFRLIFFFFRFVFILHRRLCAVLLILLWSKCSQFEVIVLFILRCASLCHHINCRSLWRKEKYLQLSIKLNKWINSNHRMRLNLVLLPVQSFVCSCFASFLCGSSVAPLLNRASVFIHTYDSLLNGNHHKSVIALNPITAKVYEKKTHTFRWEIVDCNAIRRRNMTWMTGNAMHTRNYERKKEKKFITKSNSIENWAVPDEKKKQSQHE